ncbi:MAG TPA: efflux transporter periplasmic adaptor subunit [Deltaproteobacteria bacterium]|nr:efflux transporter periplasmic adaptor subunit [Deltaproteobacteria bacterium]HBG72326.1 efflux transporter periplasmic adaptor subunit [Deltaproteobacteria bacterium]
MKPKETVRGPLKLFLVLMVLLVGLLPGGCGNQQQSAPPAVPEVATMTVKPQQVVLTTELPGRTSAYRVAEIRPQVNGLIQKRLFTEGSHVSKGQALYQIDPAPFQAVLDNAKAAVAKAEANLHATRSRAERFKELLPEKAVSRQEYDDAAAALKQTEADIEYWKAMVQTARINLGYTRITAPVSGRIGKSNVTEGALVTAQQPAPLSIIQQLDSVYVDVPQSTAEMLRLKRLLEGGRLNRGGAGRKKVKLFLEDGTAYPLAGTLQFRDVTVDPTTASVILRVVFPNPQGVLLPGMFVRAVVREGIKEQAILIPQQAVSRDPKGDPVALVVDAGGKVSQRMLTLDRAIGDKWLVTTGLESGDRVIAEGMQRARPGASVKVVPFEAAKSK